ncbi:MAG: glycosyltransferase, partial [Sulfolobales archaeon]
MERKHSVDISIVIPTYNEAENIEELLTGIKNSLESAGIVSYEVIVVDDSSSDGTAEIARNVVERLKIPGRIIVRSGHRGLTSAIMRGFAESRGKYIVVMDADLQHPPETIPGLFEKASNEDLDVVIASRYIKGGGIEGAPIHRRFIS